MPDLIVETVPGPVTLSEPSMADLRSAVNGLETDAPAPTTEVPAIPAEESAETKPEVEPGTAEEKQEAEDEEEELPRGVQKRVEKIARETARIQAEIDRATSQKLAKEAELKKLNSGSQPEPTSEKASEGEPTEPKQEDFQTMGEYWAAERAYKAEYRAWLVAETRKLVVSEMTAAQAGRESKQAFEAGLKEHPDLQQHADTVLANSPEPIQIAISALDNWAGVTVHLGKHPEELAALVQSFQVNPYAAVAQLGKLEAKLSAPKQAVAAAAGATKTLPPPPKSIGGGANASTPAVDLNSEGTTYRDMKKEFKRLIKAEK